MISCSAIGSSAAASNYHQEAWERGGEGKAEYYAKEQVPNVWGGEGAAHAGFGVGQEVKKDDFIAALDGHLKNADGTTSNLGKWGKNAETGEKEWQHRAGMDFTFAPAKSVSMVGLVGKDERMVAAHEAATERAMAYLEKYAAYARVTKDGETRQTATGNLVYAKFSHETTRNLDPQIHTHVVIANATYDKDNGIWRSVSNEKLLELRTTADAVYKTELARELKNQGYKLDFQKGGDFEIRGISREQIEGFSTRSTEIKDWLKEKGLEYKEASYKQQEAATQATRANKADFQRSDIQSAWEARANEQGLDIKKIVEATKQHDGSKIDHRIEQAAAEAALAKATNHLAEREAMFSRPELIRATVDFAQGRTSADQIEKAIGRSSKDGALIVRSEDKFTTPIAIEREKTMVKVMIAGREALDQGIIKSDKLDGKLDQLDKLRGFALNEGQRDAARMVLTTQDRFTSIQGPAGTGKTTMLEAVREIAESQGAKVIGMSSGAKQAAVLEADSGIKSQTIASFLIELRQSLSNGVQKPTQVEPATLSQALARSKVGGGIDSTAMDQKSDVLERSMKGVGRSLHQSGTGWEKIGPTGDSALSRGAIVIRHAYNEWNNGNPADKAKETGQRQLWVVDEASLTSQKDMSELMKHAVARDVQVVLVGDKQQHQSVESGKAFEQLQAAGIRQTELTEVRRQTDDIGKAAVKDVLARDNTAAYDKLAKVEISGNQHLIERLAKDYAKSPDRDETVIVTATNADRKAINEAVRAELKGNGVIDSQDKHVETLQRVDMSKAESREAFRYQENDVLRADRQYKSEGIAKGEYLRIEKVNDEKNTLTVRSEKTGQTHIINPTQKANFTAYRAQETGFAKGDKVRFNLNDKGAGVKNGETGQVEKINGNKMAVRLGNGANVRSIEIDTKAYRHVEHAHASTSYSAQGATEKKTMYHINTGTAAGVGDKSFYVGITRAKEGTTVYTTNQDKARELVARVQDKTVAIDAKREANALTAKSQQLVPSQVKTSVGSSMVQANQLAREKSVEINAGNGSSSRDTSTKSPSQLPPSGIRR